MIKLYNFKLLDGIILLHDEKYRPDPINNEEPC